MKLALTAVVASATIGFFVTTTLGNTQTYKKVEQLGDLAQWKGKEMMVHGTVVPGSIREQIIEQDTSRTFVLQSGGARVRVFNAGPKPDTFKDESDVVAIGRIISAADVAVRAKSFAITVEDNYVVDATELRAKCPTRYTGALSNKNLKQPLDK